MDHALGHLVRLGYLMDPDLRCGRWNRSVDVLGEQGACEHGLRRPLSAREGEDLVLVLGELDLAAQRERTLAGHHDGDVGAECDRLRHHGAGETRTFEDEFPLGDACTKRASEAPRAPALVGEVLCSDPVDRSQHDAEVGQQRQRAQADRRPRGARHDADPAEHEQEPGAERHDQHDREGGRDITADAVVAGPTLRGHGEAALGSEHQLLGGRQRDRNPQELEDQRRDQAMVTAPDHVHRGLAGDEDEYVGDREGPRIGRDR